MNAERLPASNRPVAAAVAIRTVGRRRATGTIKPRFHEGTPRCSSPSRKTYLHMTSRLTTLDLAWPSTFAAVQAYPPADSRVMLCSTSEWSESTTPPVTLWCSSSPWISKRYRVLERFLDEPTLGSLSARAETDDCNCRARVTWFLGITAPLRDAFGHARRSRSV